MGPHWLHWLIGLATGWCGRMLYDRHVVPYRRRRAWYAGRPRLR